MTARPNNLKSLTPHILIVAMLLWALAPSNPYGYYSVMRWVVCASFIYLAAKAHEQHQQPWVWIWGVAAGIYNPIIPVHATRELWSIVNVITIAMVAFAAIAKRRGTK